MFDVFVSFFTASTRSFDRVFVADDGQASTYEHVKDRSAIVCTSDDIETNAIDAIYTALAPGGVMCVKTQYQVVDAMFFDYAYYQPGYFIGVKPGTNACYLPLFPGADLVARKPDRKLIYVLCPGADTFDAAVRRYHGKHWARPVLIPTTYYLENVMYDRLLRERCVQWQYADFVGCIASKAHEKFDVSKLDAPLVAKGDVHVFMYRGDPLLKTATRWHPRFEHVWTPVMDALGYPRSLSVSDVIPSFYANYWACRPSWMWRYIQEFARFKNVLETHGTIQEALWSDSRYSVRGEHVAGMDETRCVQTWGVPYYPYHPFVCERYPCLFFWAHGATMIAV